MKLENVERRKWEHNPRALHDQYGLIFTFREKGHLYRLGVVIYRRFADKLNKREYKKLMKHRRRVAFQSIRDQLNDPEFRIKALVV